MFAHLLCLYHNIVIACMTDALWAKRGERDITRARSAGREEEKKFRHASFVAVHYASNMCGAWLHKGLLSKLDKRKALLSFVRQEQPRESVSGYRD